MKVKEVSRPIELLQEKDRDLQGRMYQRSRGHLRSADDTQSALQQTWLTCDALEEQLYKQLAEKDECHRKELTEIERGALRES